VLTGTPQVLDDPEVQRRAEPVTDTVASNLVSEGEVDEIPSPSDDGIGTSGGFL
jgi:hypothetical protein